MEKEKQDPRRIAGVLQGPFDKDFYRRCFLRTANRYVEQDRRTDRKEYDYDSLKDQREEILEKFNSEDYNRFLVIAGQHGSGKTSLMFILAALHRGTNNGFRNVSSKEIERIAGDSGRSGLRKYERGKLCIQDYGHEDKSVQHFATVFEPMQDLIYNRWENAGLATWFTTNIVEREDFEKSWDERVQKRMEHNLDHIYLTGKNFREPCTK